MIYLVLVQTCSNRDRVLEGAWVQMLHAVSSLPIQVEILYGRVKRLVIPRGWMEIGASVGC